MKVVHWNFFKETDQLSGAKRYEDEMFDNMSHIDIQRIRRDKKNIILGARNFKSDGFDIVHATFQPLAPLKIINKPVNFILTVHDIIPKLHYNKLQKIKHMWYIIEYTIPKADKIIVYSEYNKNKLVSDLNVKSDKIHVVPLGVDSKYKQMDKECCKKVFGLDIDKKHILVVSSNAPWKNMQLVGKIVSLMKKANMVDYKVVKIGYGELSDNPDVVNLGYIAEEMMPTVYNACDIFLQPSLNEGGLPALEAMACGCPVVSADAASLKEIIGYGGILLNASNKNSGIDFLSNIQNILEDEKKKRFLTARGIKRAKEFTWVKTADKTIEVYKKCLNML